MSLLMGRIRELEGNGELPKPKAAPEITGCADIYQVLDLTSYLDCYDFFPELSSPEDYAKQEFLKRYRILENDPALKLIYISRCDPDLLKANASATPYGIVWRNGREMTNVK